MQIDEGHFTVTALETGIDCDHGPYLMYHTDNGITICLYPLDPTRISFHETATDEED